MREAGRRRRRAAAIPPTITVYSLREWVAAYQRGRTMIELTRAAPARSASSHPRFFSALP
jgi:hypothetical protein